MYYSGNHKKYINIFETKETFDLKDAQEYFGDHTILPIISFNFEKITFLKLFFG